MKLIKILSIAIVLVLIAAVTFVVLFDANDYKDKIAANVKEATGRDLTIGGQIEHSLGAWTRIKIEDVVLGNAEGFGDQPFLKIGEFEISVKTMPLLLNNQLEMDTIRLHGAEINLARNAQGETNWADLVSEEESEPSSLVIRAIGGADIKGAKLTWQDAQAGVRHIVSNISADTGELTFGKPIDITMSADIKSNKPALDTDLTFSGTVAYDLDAESYTLEPMDLTALVRGKNVPGGETKMSLTGALDVNLDEETMAVRDLKLDALGTAISGVLSASDILDEKPALSGELNIDGKDLALIFKVAEVEPLASEIARMRDRAFMLTAKLDADGAAGNIELTDLNAKLLGATVTGNVRARDAESEDRAFAGQLKAVGPDLPMLMEVLGQFQAGEEKKLATIGKDLRKTRQKSFDIDVSFDADMKTGNIDVSRLSVKALGATLNGNLKAEKMNSKRGSVNGKFQLRGDRPVGLLTALGQAELGKVVRTLAADATIQGSGNEFTLRPLTANAKLAGKQIPNGPVDVSLSTAAVIDLDKETATVSELVVKGLGLDVKGNLNAAKILGDDPSYNGNLNVAAFNLRRLLKQLNQEVPKMAGPKALQRVALNTAFSGTSTSLSANNFSLKLDESSINGGFSIANFEDPSIEFTIAIDKINADNYLEPEDKNKKPAAAKAPTNDAQSLRDLRAMKLKGDLTVGQLTFANARMRDVKFSINAKDGKIDMNPLSANLYNGSYRGDVGIDATGKAAQIKINSKLAGVQAEPLLVDLTGSSKVTGVANFDAQLSAVGTGADSIKRTLNGQAGFSIQEGIFRGMDVGASLREAEQLLESRKLGQPKQGNQTVFDQVSGTIKITNGVLQNNDLTVAHRASGLPARGSSVTSLPKRLSTTCAPRWKKRARSETKTPTIWAATRSRSAAAARYPIRAVVRTTLRY